MQNEVKVIKEQEIFGKGFRIYGDIENPLFLAKDVAEFIDYSKDGRGNYNVSTMLSKVDDDEKQKIFMNLNNSKVGSNTWFLTEDGLYEVLMQSRKPIAKQFKKEVKKILKQIRTTCGYIGNSDEMTDEEIMAKALLVAQKTISRKNELIEKQNKQLEEQKPLVEFANTITESSDSIDVGTFAKLIKDEGIKLARNNLFKWLRDNKYLRNNNEPYQKYVDMNIFEIKEYTIKTPYKEMIQIKTLITGKGQIYLVEKLRRI